jgi:hypothetical protein
LFAQNNLIAQANFLPEYDNQINLVEWLKDKKFKSVEDGLIIEYGEMYPSGVTGFTFTFLRTKKTEYFYGCNVEINSDQSFGIFTDCFTKGFRLGKVNVDKAARTITWHASNGKVTCKLVE